MSLFIDGKLYEVPGVYGAFEVINLGVTTLPAFNGLLIIGNARQGIPYNATGKLGSEKIKAFSSVKKAKEFFGVCDLTKAMEEAKRGGAGVCYLATPAQLTRPTVTLKDTTAVTPLDVFSVKPVIYGAPGNDVYLDMEIAGGVLSVSITPPKLTKFLAEDLDGTGKTTIKLDNVEGLYIGQTIIAEDNGTTTNYATKQIVDIDSVNKTITLDTALVSLAQADYARIFVADNDNKVSKNFDATAGDLLTQVLDFINQSGILEAERTASHTGDIATLATVSDYIGDINSPTLGVSPVATTTASGDFDNFADALPQMIEEFTNVTKARVRLLNVISHVSTVHSKFNTVATTLRNQKNSVMIISGCNSGDIALADSNANSPIARAKALNSDQFVLAGHGYEDKAGYLSLAPYLAGMISSNNINHNLTYDSLSFSKVEKFFGESNKETETVKYVRNGVIVVGTGKNGFYLVHGYNTYQNHAQLWNESDEKSYLVQQRQLADFVYDSYREEMEAGVGADGYTVNSAKSKGLKKLEQLFNLGYITQYRITEAYREGNAVVTVPEVVLAEATDFIGFIVRIVNPS